MKKVWVGLFFLMHLAFIYVAMHHTIAPIIYGTHEKYNAILDPGMVSWEVCMYISMFLFISAWSWILFWRYHSPKIHHVFSLPFGELSWIVLSGSVFLDSIKRLFVPGVHSNILGISLIIAAMSGAFFCMRYPKKELVSRWLNASGYFCAILWIGFIVLITF